MPVIQEEGKDTIIFVTKEEHHGPKTVELEEEEEYGLIKPNGDINWDCPCLQGMADGPCGQQFRAAFSCFHFSEAEPKGSDCIPQFRDMQSCFQEYPDIYGGDDEEKEGDMKGTDGQEALAGEDKKAGTSEVSREENTEVNTESDTVAAEHVEHVNSESAIIDDTTPNGKPSS